MLSKSCVYGLRASLFLASNRDQDYVSIREMSDKLNISFHFLTKILQQLSAAGLMESYKGPNGGVRLTKSGSQVNLFEIIAAIDGVEVFTECALGLPGCGTEKPCPLHDKWADARDGIRKMLEETDLVELAKKGKKQNLRITADGSFEWE
ncbi:Rrf2 family transcriptional regulator [Balneolaceae bacterium YR4-1]|uniref:Rrf2 family transcriptional regulator n=1 Tax=Halalkalibaculum roseum TaxID=2709311 RepID=A0A6M1T6F5_9BACT|nr:Rrf2 family transcriptional regulator [Halalkalibaculum roseum]